MHQQRHWMGKMVALVMMAYALGLVLGETLRSQLFPESHRKHRLCFGPFVLLKLKWNLPYHKFKQVASQALRTFAPIAHPVQTHV